MKKNLIIIATLLVAAGCVKETSAPEPGTETNGFTIEAVSAPKIESKTTLVDNGEFYWYVNSSPQRKKEKGLVEFVGHARMCNKYSFFHRGHNSLSIGSLFIF